ncbi:MAG: TonB-dependent receptor [Gammaproteobacteria bacterium]|nr:TonB-dependent receptor [Gammaproteobacteria bacterium]
MCMKAYAGSSVFLSAILLSLALTSRSILAADSPELVIITASRVPQNIDDILASVTVIDRAEIERSQARTLDEILAKVEGISIARSGGVGQVTSIFLRGSESDHTLWLIDGIRIGSVTAGLPALQDLPIDSIERIEIVRGPRSSLYGADAVGGVIQIFTRRDKGATPSARVTMGSAGSVQGSAAVGLIANQASFDLQVSHLKTDGSNACLGLPYPPGGGCFTLEPDRDPYRNTSGNFRATYQFDEGSELEGFVQRSKAHVAFDSSWLNESDLINQIAGIKFSTVLIDQLRSNLSVGRSWDKSTSLRKGSSYTSVFNSSRESVSWQNDLRFAGGDWVLGLDWLRDQIQSDTAYVETARDNKAVFGQYASQIGAQSVTAALRLDDNQQFSKNTTGSLGWGFRFKSGLQAYASFGTAFKAPSFNDLYYPDFGNSDLLPEHSRTGEFGFKQKLDWGRWAVSAYRSEVKDLVAFDLDTYLPQNIQSAHIVGLEGSLQWHSGPWHLHQSLSILQAEDRSKGASSGRELPRRPKFSASSSLGWLSGDWDLGASFQYVSRRYDDLANARRLGGYGLLDLTVDRRMHSVINLQLRLSNALDHQYQNATLYPALGREVFLTVRYRAPR